MPFYLSWHIAFTGSAQFKVYFLPIEKKKYEVEAEKVENHFTGIGLLVTKTDFAHEEEN
jgi:hypothetical protein